MAGCLPARYRLLDLLFALSGTVAFMGDLGSDVWSTVKYFRKEDTVWAVLYLTLFLLSSLVLQCLSCGWFWVDLRDWKLQECNAGCGTAQENGAQICGDPDSVQPGGRPPSASNGDTKHRSNGTKYPEHAASVVDAVPIEMAEYRAVPDTPATPEEPPDPRCPEDELRSFRTSKIIESPPCLVIVHVLQLGYLLRCIHSLEVGIAAYRNPEDDLFKDYAYFLTHDISMMRLVETFLENTPQLILMLYIIIQTEAIEMFQCFSIFMSFICISWAILDYHQSLRLFLQGKQTLSILSSVVYYLWNFCLISSRILCVMLFTVTFQWMIVLHFFLCWIVFFSWATLQKTTFMKQKCLELVYRATVAIILYFSWFNIADGRTIYRCVIYHLFIVMDSVILVVSWQIFKIPSILDGYETCIIVTNLVVFAVGLLLRLLYYKCLHPNIHSETKEYFDVPDGLPGRGTSQELLSAGKPERWVNDRMKCLSSQIY